MSVPTNEAPSKPSVTAPPPTGLGAKLNRLVEEYGRLALIVFFTLSALNWSVVLAAIFLGVEFEATSTLGQTAGVGMKLAAAWAVTRVTWPFRVGLTLALTPVLARFFGTKKKA